MYCTVIFSTATIVLSLAFNHTFRVFIYSRVISFIIIQLHFILDILSPLLISKWSRLLPHTITLTTSISQITLIYDSTYPCTIRKQGWLVILVINIIIEALIFIDHVTLILRHKSPLYELWLLLLMILILIMKVLLVKLLISWEWIMISCILRDIIRVIINVLLVIVVVNLILKIVMRAIKYLLLIHHLLLLLLV